MGFRADAIGEADIGSDFDWIWLNIRGGSDRQRK